MLYKIRIHILLFIFQSMNNQKRRIQLGRIRGKKKRNQMRKKHRQLKYKHHTEDTIEENTAHTIQHTTQHHTKQHTHLHHHDQQHDSSSSLVPSQLSTKDIHYWHTLHEHAREQAMRGQPTHLYTPLQTTIQYQKKVIPSVSYASVLKAQVNPHAPIQHFNTQEDAYVMPIVSGYYLPETNSETDLQSVDLTSESTDTPTDCDSLTDMDADYHVVYDVDDICDLEYDVVDVERDLL